MVEDVDEIPFEFIIAMVEAIPQINIDFLIRKKGDPLNAPVDVSELYKNKRKEVTEIGKGLDPVVCSRIRDLRIASGLTQEDFDEKMSSSRHTQASIENLRNNLSTHYLRALHKKYNIDLNWVITELGSKETLKMRQSGNSRES